MENCLLTHYIFNKEVKSSCDFNQFELEKHQGVYEVVKVINGIPLFLEDHISRLNNSLETYYLKPLLSLRQIKTRIKALIEVNKLSSGNLKFHLLIHDNRKPDFYVWVSEYFYPTPLQYFIGVNCGLLDAVRDNPNSKTFKHRVRELADKYLKTNDEFEVILRNQSGQISEGSRSNLFFINKGVVFTSPDNMVLKGVTRQKVINICVRQKIKIEREVINMKTLPDYDSAFLSGTSINIIPINTIESVRYNINNELLTFLSDEYEKLVNEYLSNFNWNL